MFFSVFQIAINGVGLDEKYVALLARGDRGFGDRNSLPSRIPPSLAGTALGRRQNSLSPAAAIAIAPAPPRKVALN